MKRIKKLVILLIAIFPVMNLYSQNQDTAYPHVIPMTPNAAEFAKYGDFPVSYYTGTPNTSVPLYEIDVDGFKLPINLRYHASGIKVDQEATWIGLGWSLDVGSRISRTVKSADDFLMNFDQNYPRCEKGYYEAPDISSNLDNHYQMSMSAGLSCYYSGVLGSLSYDLKYDPEPDIFYYNLPNMNGKFILDKSRGAVLFDKSHNLKIEVIKSSGSVVFKIIDSEGNQYIYDQTEITRNYSTNGWLNKNIETNNTKYDSDPSSFTEWRYFRTGCETITDASSQNAVPIVTSWCLSKIITNKGREINFIYDTEMQYLPVQESCEKYSYNHDSWQYYYKSKVVNNALRLKTISGDFGRIEFATSDRFDIKGTSKKLDLISIYNSINTLIKSYKFDYTYFNNDYSGNYQYEHVFKRLKLSKVVEYSGDSPLNNGYVFDYYEGNFPAKNSKNVDYWGFQNGKNYGENYIIGVKINNLTLDGVKKESNFQKSIIGTLKKITYPTGGTVEFKYEANKLPSGYFDGNTYESVSNSGNTTAAIDVYNYYSVNPYPELYPPSRVYNFQINSLTNIKITGSLENSTGKRDPNYDYRNINRNPLGRLRKISPISNTLYTYDCPHIYDSSPTETLGIGSEVILAEKEFTLDAGNYEFTAYSPPRDVLVNWRLLSRTDITPQHGVPSVPIDVGGIRISEIKTDAQIRRFRYPVGNMLVAPTLYYFGRREGIPDYIGSCTVQVSESKTPLSTFNHGNFVGYDWVEEYIWDEEDDTSTIKYNFYNDSESEKFDDSFPDSPFYLNYTNGLVKSIEKFKMYQGGQSTLVEKNEFSYTSTYSNFIQAFRDRAQKRWASDLLRYNYKVEWPLKTKLTNTLQTDDGKSIVTETNYTYNTKDLIQSTTYNVDNTQIIEKVKYPFDFSDSVNSALTAKNMIGVPVETLTLKDNVVTQAVKTEYFSNSGVYLPKTILKTEFNSPVTEADYASYYKSFLNFDSYTAKGKLVESRYSSGPSTYYIWGYNDQYPIAKLENFTTADAINIQSIINSVISASNTDVSLASENLLRTALNNLRDAAPAAMVTTYTYDPLIGITSVTDSKGYTMYYQYDEFNRLKQVVNTEGNIVEKNEYNYKQ
ncbi:hypothetical protein [Flavobacterium tructae]|uniref:hypothetical protein n=1 Tax=Flavobacterium tructae TaxID=1114873 RepID=UPI0035A84700